MNEFKNYLSATQEETRILILAKMKQLGETIPTEECYQLLHFNFSLKEKIALLQVCSREDVLAFEIFVTNHLAIAEPNLAGVLLKIWDEETEHRLWEQVLTFAEKSTNSQRIAYSLLEYATPHCGEKLFHVILTHQSILEWSTTYHSLLIRKSYEWRTRNALVENIVEKYVLEISQGLHSNIADLHLAIFTWITIFTPLELNKIKAIPTIQKSWGDWLDLLCEDLKKNSLFLQLHPQKSWKKPDNFKNKVPETQLMSAKSAFYAAAYENKSLNSSKIEKQNFWTELFQCWKNPTSNQLENLTEASRQQPYLYQICFLKTLGRFKNSDTAVLKILDYIRSTDDVLLSQVIETLGEIATNKSKQELLTLITRNNISTELKWYICDVLGGQDFSSLQSFLKTTIKDVETLQLEVDIKQAIVEQLKKLILPAEALSHPLSSEQSSSADLDTKLLVLIPLFNQLSSESKRSLRTAMFFHTQLISSPYLDQIDLSPLIDMQYKSLELLFREHFEEKTFQSIHNGILQRKLDKIGYARPIEEKMLVFENYIASLPEIKTIPFFSKFKLRKLLRGICQYHPGKRFTLDGIKAYGFFFLVFSRKECPFGLAEVFPIQFPSDLALMQFSKSLHIFQDLRNRAIHEGFQGDMAKEINQLWSYTDKIITNVLSF